MRAGRFDRQIYVDLPDVRERKEIFEVHLKPIKKTRDLDVDFLEGQDLGDLAEKELEFTELDINFLEVDFLRDLLEVIEEADALAEQEEGSFSDRLVDRSFGLQPDNQFNILPDVDGKVFFLRQANNYVSLKLQKGTTALLDITDKDLGSTIICLNSCEGTVITIIQN